MTTEYDKAMATWEVSPILVPVITELKGKHPGIVIGTIGDQAHRAEVSDHNPDQWGYVCAADPMIGPHFTEADAEDLFDRITAFIRGGDRRAAFIVYNRRIVSSTVQPGVIRKYTGSDPHTGHVHLSVPHSSNPRPTTSWDLFPQGKDDKLTPAQMEELATMVADKVVTHPLGRSGPNLGMDVEKIETIAADVADIKARLDTLDTPA
jgi:hypothetical protein